MSIQAHSYLFPRFLHTFLLALAAFAAISGMVGMEAHAEQNKLSRTGDQDPRGLPPGFGGAAAALGVSPDALFSAMTDAGGPRANFVIAADQLGVAEGELGEALDMASPQLDRPLPTGGRGWLLPPNMPPGFEDAAAALGVTSDELFTAMTDAGGPNANLTEAANQLGVKQDSLEEVLIQISQDDAAIP